MIYLTKILLNPGDCSRYKLKDAYSYHKFIYSLFPLEKKEENPRILFVNKGSREGRKELLIQSAILPVLPDEMNALHLEITDRFLGLDRYRFEIILNPVKRSVESKKREPVKGQLPLLKWFMKHEEEWGFSTDEEHLEVFPQDSVVFEKDGKENRFHKVMFRGVLTVTNREKFLAGVRNGVGHGKAFGFGMFQLAK